MAGLRDARERHHGHHRVGRKGGRRGVDRLGYGHRGGWLGRRLRDGLFLRFVRATESIEARSNRFEKRDVARRAVRDDGAHLSLIHI
eukprot:2337069-Prymnesium_polylepis.2